MKKLDYIDGLKGIGALMVFFCHFVFAFYYAAYSLTGDAVNTNSGIEITIGKTPLNLLYSGNSAVCLFLVFSGFVLCLSYFHTRDKGRLKSVAWKRYFRLMPMILMINTLIFVLMSLGCYRNDEAAILTKSTVWFAGFNQFQPNFLQMLGESLAGCFLFGTNNYNGALWTIPYLFSGALVVYLAAYLVGENPFRYVVYLVMLLAAVKTDIYFAGIFLGFAASDFFCTRQKGMELWRRFWLLPLGSFVLGVYLLSYPSIGSDMSGTIYGILPSAYTTLYHLAGAALLLRDKSMVGAFTQGAFRGSQAILGVAFVQNLYECAGLVPLMIVASVPLYNIFSVLVLTVTAPDAGAADHRGMVVRTLRGIITNPIILGILAGLPFSLLSIDFPPMADKFLGMLGGCATPMALLSIGASFEGAKAIKKLGPTCAATFIKLILLPVIFLPIAVHMGFREQALVAIVILCGAPSTVSGYVMAKNMGADHVLSSSIIVLTTVLSAITLTLTLFILKSLALI